MFCIVLLHAPVGSENLFFVGANRWTVLKESFSWTHQWAARLVRAGTFSANVTIQGSSGFREISAQGAGCRVLGGVPREQKMLNGHLPTVIYHRVYRNTMVRGLRVQAPVGGALGELGRLLCERRHNQVHLVQHLVSG